MTKAWIIWLTEHHIHNINIDIKSNIISYHVISRSLKYNLFYIPPSLYQTLPHPQAALWKSPNDPFGKQFLEVYK